MDIPKDEKVSLVKALEYEYLRPRSIEHTAKFMDSSRTDVVADTFLANTGWNFISGTTSVSIGELRDILKEALSLFPKLHVPANMDMHSHESTETMRFATIMKSLGGNRNTLERSD